MKVFRFFDGGMCCDSCMSSDEMSDGVVEKWGEIFEAKRGDICGDGCDSVFNGRVWR